jgi:hypothetical protein
MKKDDLKKLIKPLVKECIHEVLLEEGLLSSVVSEVVKGMQGNLVLEAPQKQSESLLGDDLQMKRKSREVNNKLREHREKLMNSVGASAYNGVNLFENTEPMSKHEAVEPRLGSVDLGSAADSGVDISSIMGDASKIWKAMK